MKNAMMPTLTAEQVLAIAKSPEEPIRTFHPETKKIYVLLSEEAFAKMTGVQETDFRPRDAYAAVDRTFAAGWDDPKMDDYDRYDEIRQ